MRVAQRVLELDGYLFDLVDEVYRQRSMSNGDVIALGVGDCDLPTPASVVAALRDAATDQQHHRYPPYDGTVEFRDAATRYLARRFGVDVDADAQMVATLGSKEAMAHLSMALVDPGDVVLVPDPGYPVYANWARLCGAEVHFYPLRAESGFLPELDRIPADVARRAKLMWLCYPNNPTAAVANLDAFGAIATFADRYGIAVASDVAYGELYFGEPPPSFLAAPGGMDCGIEFHSLSKAYNMAGWRLGFAAGNASLVAALKSVKRHCDSGAFGAIQHAGAVALGDDSLAEAARRVYRDRAALLHAGLVSVGFEFAMPAATFYCWVPVPNGWGSEQFSEELLRALAC